MAEVTDYTKYLPIQPPEGYLEWVLDNNRLGGDYIIYRQGSRYEPLEERMKRAVLCRCTACGNEYHLDYCSSDNKYQKFGFVHPESKALIFSRSECKCPVCNAKATAMHCTEFGTKYDSDVDDFYGLTIERVLDGIALYCWCTVRNINRSGREAYNTYPYEAYLFTKTERIRFNGRRYNCSGRPYFTGTWRQLKQFQDNVGPFTQGQIFPWDKSILNGSEPENCKLDIYSECAEEVFPVSYMYLWQRFPNIENLIMQGFGGYINYRIAKTRPKDDGYYPCPSGAVFGLKLKKAKPNEILDIGKAECRILSKEEWLSEEIDFYIRTHKQGITLDNIYKYMSESESEALILVGYPVDIPRALRYIAKQQVKWAEGSDRLINSRYYTDYLDMAKYNGDNLRDDKVLFPHNLKRVHDTAMREMNIRKAEEKAKCYRDKAEKVAAMFAKRYSELEKYCYSSKGLSIHPCKDELEIIMEGKILNHCVASYARRHAEGQTAIFFIRHEDKPDEPYFTLEFNFNSMRVMQNRGFENDDRTPEVEAFEKKWVKFVKQVVAKERKAA